MYIYIYIYIYIYTERDREIERYIYFKYIIYHLRKTQFAISAMQQNTQIRRTYAK